ncbi:hypothetical protein O0B05_09965 [Staphylococcus pseudintermedius]|nr:hypothetical protein [Staphylococcus pseudintermedius]MDK3623202.1 hypothetical protein [Staphylococcus pseudintermedius]MDK3793953.1 hypothetical protein [Staphylococcus pseudintermedius]
MKIKVKKRMKLHELIKWGLENGVRNEKFYNLNNTNAVSFDSDGDIVFSHTFFSRYAEFTVEVEETITEETVIPNLLEVYEYDSTLVLEVRKDKSIKDLLDSDDYDGVTIKAFHIVNDDSTHTLIWKDGEMV